MLESTLSHLEALVSFDTRNPPRKITPQGGIFGYLCEQLPGFDLDLQDHGAGAVSLHAVRGAPKLLFNVHLDTVPDSPDWSANPFTLRVDGERAVGLGACDIKGAAASLLAAVAATDGDVGLLFSSDEEANDPRCIEAFLKRGIDYETVVVAEPTRTRAVLAHRGISSVMVGFEGRAGHASARQERADSALHQAVEWGHGALAIVDQLEDEQFGELSGLRFNIGRIEGGIKANMIAPRAELRFNFRPLPSMGIDTLLARFRDAGIAAPAVFKETFRGPSLPAGDPAQAGARHQSALEAARALGIEIGTAVDFWTEAALFSAAGYRAFVYGPGDIAQAHAADEWVALDQLDAHVQSVVRILESS